MAAFDIAAVFVKLNGVTTLDFKSLHNIIQPIENSLLLIEKNFIGAPVSSSEIRVPPSCTYANLNLDILKEFCTVQSTGNGDCLFNSLSIVFCGDEKYSSSLRLILLRHILKNWDRLSENSEGLFNCHLSVILKNLITLGLWGTEKHLFMFSEIFNRPIYVFEYFRKSGNSFSSFINSNPFNKDKVPVFLNLCANHWEPLIVKTSSNRVHTITKNKSKNFYQHILHPYIFNATYSVPHSRPNVLSLKSFNLSEEKKEVHTNERFLELLKFNSQLQHELRKARSLQTRQNDSLYLPKPNCQDCLSLTNTLKDTEEESRKNRQQFNIRGERIINKVHKLQHENELLQCQVHDLRIGQELLQNTLKNRNEVLTLLVSKPMDGSELKDKNLTNFASSEPNISPNWFDNIWHDLEGSIPPTPATPECMKNKNKGKKFGSSPFLTKTSDANPSKKKALATQYHGCVFCGAIFKENSLLFSHLKKFHHIDGFLKPSKKFSKSIEHTYKCKSCSSLLGSKFALKRHEESHNALRTSFPCSKCEKTFCRKEFYKKHFIRAHTGPASYKCRFCSYTLKGLKAIQNHERNRHFDMYTNA